MLNAHMYDKVEVLPVAAVTATGVGAPVDVLDYEGTGKVILHSAAGTGTTPTLAVKLQESEDIEAGPAQATAGTTDIDLRTASDDNVLLGASVTPDESATLKQVWLPLKMKGELTSGDVWVTILADSSGPSGSALATSAKIAASTIDADAYDTVIFTFATPLDVTAETKYWIVLQGDYTASATNQILWRSKTVASEGNSATNNGSAWSAVATEDMEYATQVYVFSDITGKAFAAIDDTAGGSLQALALNIGTTARYIRAAKTAGGSNPSFTCGAILVAKKKYT